jgi:hypothetical protein
MATQLRKARPMLDPRGPRFAAAITSVVVAVVLLTGSGWLMLVQAFVFAVGALNIRWAPYAAIYRVLVAPRLAPPAEREPAAPVRFSQGVGCVFTLVSAAGYLAGAPVVGLVGAGAALVAAFLNAAFGVCLGCEVYLAIRRLRAG